MKKTALFAFLLAVAIGVRAQEALNTSDQLNGFQLQAGSQDDPNDPPMLSPAWVPESPEYEYQLQQQYGLLNLYMCWHGGRVMPKGSVTAIFWGKRWTSITSAIKSTVWIPGIRALATPTMPPPATNIGVRTARSPAV